MIRTLSAGALAAGVLLAACAPTTATTYHAADAPTVGVATKASPSTSPTLSSGLNTQTTAERASSR